MAILAPSAHLLVGCASQPDYRDAIVEPSTVASVDLEKYAGLWHEVARYPNRFQKGCIETTATYALLSSDRVSVVNQCRKDDGSTDKAEGIARVITGSNGAKLKVRFAPKWVPFAEGDYWVFHLEDDYSAALVGAPSGKYLWILGRTPALEADVEARILKKAQELGFQTEPLFFANR